MLLHSIIDINPINCLYFEQVSHENSVHDASFLYLDSTKIMSQRRRGETIIGTCRSVWIQLNTYTRPYDSMGKLACTESTSVSIFMRSKQLQ